ncbi:MAG: ACT domain-containing protein [Desulfovibrionales bacterium]|nr:ACT domain-containing protein [Desulfovibrionales bacterium]
MKKVVVSFLGQDGPGVVCAVASLLTELDCNILELSQTILHSEFAAIVIAEMDDEGTVEALQKDLEKGLVDKNVDLNVIVRMYDGNCWNAENPEPFVVSVDGPDQKGLVAAIAGILGKYNVNISNMKAIIPPEEEHGRALLVYEVTVPASVELAALRSTLEAKAEELSLRISLQHRDIFEAVHRVMPV